MNVVPEVIDCSYKNFMSGKLRNFKSTKGVVGLIRWFERTKSISSCAEDCKVKYATSILLDVTLSWWNSFVQPIGIEGAYKIAWTK